MLEKIPKSTIAELWKILAPMIQIAIPELYGKEERNMVNILEAMLDGSLIGWLIYSEGENPQMLGLVTTYFTFDAIGGSKSLMIYSLYGVDRIPKRVWFKGIETIKKFAKASNCHYIIALTTLEHFKDNAKKLGADVSTTLIKMEV